MRCIVLKTTLLRESDLILTVLTDSDGKQSFLAKGARRSKRRFMGGLDIFDCGELTVTPQRGANRMPLVESFTNRENFLGLRADLFRLSLASLVVELVIVFTSEGDGDDVLYFAPLYRALKHLSAARDQRVCLREVALFLLDLLQLAGFDPLHAPPRPVSSGCLNEVWSQIATARSSDTELSNADFRRAIDGLLDFTEEVVGIKFRTREHLVFSTALPPELSL